MTPTLRERLNAGSGTMMGAAIADGRHKVRAGRKPWSERDRAPWGDGDPDGDDNGVYDIPPGEEDSRAPNPNPGGDDARLRYTTAAGALAVAASNPEASRALLAVEARLAEISLYLPVAMRGLPDGALLSSLQFLQRIL